ncbi:hypothetical protein F5888DRAFT_1890167 [Russula emetica]|nr:hypothetical protein F5888DRAFT_1890167 [Russula emetica]
MRPKHLLTLSSSSELLQSIYSTILTAFFLLYLFSEDSKTETVFSRRLQRIGTVYAYLIGKVNSRAKSESSSLGGTHIIYAITLLDRVWCCLPCCACITVELFESELSSELTDHYLHHAVATPVVLEIQHYSTVYPSTFGKVVMNPLIEDTPTWQCLERTNQTPTLADDFLMIFYYIRNDEVYSMFGVKSAITVGRLQERCWAQSNSTGMVAHSAHLPNRFDG